MEKYRLLREAVVEHGLLGPVEITVPDRATDEQILRAHHQSYLAKVTEGELTDREVRRIGFPWSPELVERARCSVGGTIAACRTALEDGIGVNLAGGTHHAFPDHGQGYCLFNDVVIAIRELQTRGRIRRAVILDGDVHQGNGTAAMVADDPTVFTFSVHGAHNFPLRKERSDLDIGLEDGAGDDAYLAAWERGVDLALERSNPNLAVFLAGADPYWDDRLGRLAVTIEGLGERDRVAFERCGRAGVPVAVVMGGGYARNVKDTVRIHLQTVLTAAAAAPRLSARQ
jgi:acetoin utilization deacetylase AcuC-like enzyme